MDLMYQEMQAQTLTHPAMGTIMTHQSYGENSQDCLTTIQMEIERLEALFSRFRPGSDISRINQAAGEQMVCISEETMAILDMAQDFTRTWPNAFDITVTPLVNLWRKAALQQQLPTQAEIDTAKQLVNSADLMLDHEPCSAMLRSTGQSLDLGGIAKGYAANRLLDCYLAFGIHSAFSNLGGNVIALGCKPDGSAWKIGIQHPRQENQLIGVVAISNESVVTSGDYQRYFTGKDGKRYHHIINPQTGYPSTSDLISVTIITRDSMLADTLSTLLFVTGLQKSTEILENHPECEAILVDKNLQTYITKGLHDRFTPAGTTSLTILNPNGVISK